MVIIINKYLYSAKFTNKCALMRCLIKYIVIHCFQHIYINTHTYVYIHMCTYTKYILLSTYIYINTHTYIHTYLYNDGR